LQDISVLQIEMFLIHVSLIGIVSRKKCILYLVYCESLEVSTLFLNILGDFC
jgi:hypothetical protein